MGKLFETPEKSKILDNSRISYIHRQIASWQSSKNLAPSFGYWYNIIVVLTIYIALCNPLEKDNSIFCYMSLQLLKGYSREKMKRKLIALDSEAQPTSSSSLSSRICYFMESSTRTELLCTCAILTSKQQHNFHMKGQFVQLV